MKKRNLSVAGLLSGALLYMAIITVTYGIEPILTQDEVYHFAQEDPIAKLFSVVEDKISDWGSGTVGSKSGASKRTSPMDTDP